MSSLKDACWGCQMGWQKVVGADGIVKHDSPEPMGDIHCTAPQPEVSKKTHGKVNHSMAGRVEVKVDTDKQPFCRVTVFSGVKKGLLRETKMRDLGSYEKNRQAAGVMAGAAAEHLCGTYDDIIDPSECAKLAMKLFEEAFRRCEELDRGTSVDSMKDLTVN